MQGDLAGAVDGDGERGGAGGEFRVVDTDVVGGAVADVVPSHPEPVQGACRGPARHPELHDAGGLTEDAAGGVVQADDDAVPQG